MIASYRRLAATALRCSRAAAPWLVLCTLGAGSAGAEVVPDLYTITVTSDSGAADQRAAAIKRAFAQLLTRVTGSRTAASELDLQPMIESSERFVDSYGLDNAGRQRVGFSASRVERALRESSWPVWGRERPLTLLWVAVDSGFGERGLLSADGSSAEWSPEMAQLMDDVYRQLAAVAEERGLPIAFPLLDLEDIGAISFADVWGRFEDRLALASTRYGADAILVGRVRQTVFGNDVEWLLLKDGQRRLITGSTVGEGLDWVGDLYAAELSVLGDARAMGLVVLDVATLADYGRVMKYLETLSVLQEVDVESLDGDVLNLSVTARADADVLGRVLELGGVLSPSGARNRPATGGALVFRVTRAGPAQ